MISKQERTCDIFPVLLHVALFVVFLRLDQWCAERISKFYLELYSLMHQPPTADERIIAVHCADSHVLSGNDGI